MHIKTHGVMQLKMPACHTRELLTCIRSSVTLLTKLNDFVLEIPANVITFKFPLNRARHFQDMNLRKFLCNHIYFMYLLLLSRQLVSSGKKENHNICNYNDYTCIHKLGFINLLDFNCQCYQNQIIWEVEHSNHELFYNKNSADKC